MKKTTAPKIDNYIWQLEHTVKGNSRFGSNVKYDDKTTKLLDDVFATIERIAPVNKDGVRQFFVFCERGEITDWYSYRQAKEDLGVGSKKEWQEYWLDEYPDETVWYFVESYEQKEKDHYRAIRVNYKNVILTYEDKRLEESYPVDASKFLKWLLESVNATIQMIKDGKYNDFVNQNRPYNFRTGTISRKDFWNVWPEEREEFFKNISKEDVAEFCKYMDAQNEEHYSAGCEGRMDKMTASTFYHACALGYAACNYKGSELPEIDQYILHADGRDEGLTGRGDIMHRGDGGIDPDSPDEWDKWYFDRNRFGGHPWEVCRGGNSTHIDLFVRHDDGGWYFEVAGSAWTRTIEAVHFYLAIRRAGYPVFMYQGKLLASRLRETELIGIVPEHIIPAYCSDWFPPEQNIIDYMNLPFEDREKFIPYCTWQEAKPVTLLEK